jgi:hypothetical protein
VGGWVVGGFVVGGFVVGRFTCDVGWCTGRLIGLVGARPAACVEPPAAVAVVGVDVRAVGP